MRARLPVAVLAAVLLAACARASDAVPTPVRQFHLDWHVAQDPRGAVVRGHVGNPYALPARDIHLLVEGLGAAGEVVTRTTTVLRQIVLAGERTAFDVPVAGTAERYRVTVVSYDFVLPRGRR